MIFWKNKTYLNNKSARWILVFSSDQIYYSKIVVIVPLIKVLLSLSNDIYVTLSLLISN